MIGYRFALFVTIFILSAVGALLLLVGCDNGTSSLPAVPGTPGVATGQRVFSQYCNSCHPGGERGAGPALKPLIPAISDAQISYIVRHGKRPMPGYNQDIISEDQLASLLLYLRTLK